MVNSSKEHFCFKKKIKTIQTTLVCNIVTIIEEAVKETELKNITG